MITRPVRVVVPAVAAGLAFSTLSACSAGSGSLAVRTDAVGTRLHQGCAALQRALPKTLVGLHRRATTPSSDLVTAWGDPAVTLWCATAMPSQLDPRSPSYDPKAMKTTSFDVNGECWIVNATERTGNAGPQPYTLSLVRRRIFVQVHVPQQDYGMESPLPALAAAIDRTDPFDPAQRFVCS